MLKILLFVLIITVFGIIDLKPAFKAKDIKLIFLYISISSACLILCIVTELHIEIPSLAKPIKYAVDTLIGR